MESSISETEIDFFSGTFHLRVKMMNEENGKRWEKKPLQSYQFYFNARRASIKRILNQFFDYRTDRSDDLRTSD